MTIISGCISPLMMYLAQKIQRLNLQICLKIWISAADNKSWTAVSGGAEAILSKGYDKFTMPLYGAFDGLDTTRNGAS